MADETKTPKAKSTKTPAPKAGKAKSAKATKPAAKSAKAKATGEKVGGTLESRIGEKRIKLLVKENPKREGTRSHKEFALYKDGMTVAELLKRGEKIGFRTSNIAWDLKHGFIALK